MRLHAALWQNMRAEIIGLGAIGALILGYLGVIWETEPPTVQTARITGFRLTESEVGTVLRAFVSLPSGREVLVAMPDSGARCRVGGYVSAAEAHTLYGSSFKGARGSCALHR